MLEVRPSRIHGHGVFARARIAARRKIGELAGEIITVREARRRAKQTAVITIVEFEDGFALDATTDACLRYVNHSCSPNTYLRRANRRVEFYALRPIKPGEELCYDYNLVVEERYTPALKKLYACGCGAKRCRGTILGRKR